MKTIEVVVSPTGETSITTKGFSGPACREASRFLESALGTRLSEQLTGEYHVAETSPQLHEERFHE